MRQTIRALCIDGRPSGNAFRGAADYLAVALTPEGQPASRPLVQAEVAPESAIMDRNLGRYQCVLACNVAQFTASEARVLDAYLRSGGNLVFFLGDQVLPDRYNRELGGAAGRAGSSGSRAGQGRAGHASPLSLWERGTGGGSMGEGKAGEGRAGHRPSFPPNSARSSNARSPASIRWAIGIRSCNRFAAAARPAC